MLRQISVHRFAALSLLTPCQASVALWPPITTRYFAPTCSHRRLLSDSSAVTVAAPPPSPKVQSVRLPLEVSSCSYGDENAARVQHMGAASDSNLRFVSIHPNCCRSVDPDQYMYYSNNDEDCCCRPQWGRTCWHPRFVFTIKTWTMNFSMDGEPLEWVEDGQMDGEEIWALPGYEGLPHAIPKWPVVCLDKSNVVCFLVSNYHFTKDDEKLWMVKLNINTKTLLSVVQLTINNDDYCQSIPPREYRHMVRW